MEGGKHKVASESGLNSDLSGFKVADFADKDDVRILAQKRAEGGCKVQADLLFHLYLIDAQQIEFNRVFGRHDVCIDGIQRLERGIKCIRLTASGRASNQYHAV